MLSVQQILLLRGRHTLLGIRGPNALSTSPPLTLLSVHDDEAAMDWRTYLQVELDQLADAALLRQEPEPVPADALNLSSNDYLGLRAHPELKAAAITAIETWGTGSGASRLVNGTLPVHQELEAALAAKHATAGALLFGSGYLANCGIISSLVGRHDRVIADRLVHASMIDAVQMSGAELKRFRHNDVAHAASFLTTEKRCLVLTESVFSMDGDRAPVDELRDACAGKALFMVDEAHAAGVFAPARADLVMGTLSKGYGGYGGYVCCDALLRSWFVNRARAFVYTTAPPPALAASALAALRLSTPERGVELLARASAFRQILQEAGLDTGPSSSQIVPIMTGDNQRALDTARRLRARGVYVVAIRPPTVPTGTARLRCSVTLDQSPADLERAAKIIIEEMQVT